MISVCGSCVAHLGGPRGDRLSFCGEDGAFVTLADLGWDETAQCTPMRRLLLTETCVYVVEPEEGFLLQPPLRVRRFGLRPGDGESVVELESEPRECDLAFVATRQEDGTVRFDHAGIDPRSGRPLHWTRTVRTHFVTRAPKLWGTPCRAAGAWWYPILGEGLLAVAGETVREWRGTPGPARELAGKAVCVAPEGLWLDGAWQGLPDGPLFSPLAPPVGPVAVPHGESGLLILRREGGQLPVLDGPPARLPPGLYSALARLPSQTCAVAEGTKPRLVPVEF